MFGRLTSNMAHAKIRRLADKLTQDDLEVCINYLTDLHTEHKQDRLLVTIKTGTVTYQFDASQLEWLGIKNKFSLRTGTIVATTEAKEIVIRVEDIINIIGEKI